MKDDLEDLDRKEEALAEKVFFTPPKRRLTRGQRLGSFAAGAVLVWGLLTWARGAPPGCHPPAEDVAWADLAVGQRSVRVKGMAHYIARARQQAQGGDDIWNIYPLFPPDDVTSRRVRVMVRTRVPLPEDYQYGEVTVEGEVVDGERFLTDGVIGYQAINGYGLEEKVLLIDAFDDD